MNAQPTFLSWLQYGDRFSEQDCESVVELGRLYAPTPAPVGSNTVDLLARSAARRRITLLPSSLELLSRLEALIQKVSEQHFGFAISGIRAPELLEYSPGNGHFAWHRDFAYHGDGVVRKLALVIQLSNPADYEGGDLEVFEPSSAPLPRERGTILALPAFLIHRVTPVTRGLRRALVVFGVGPRFR